MRTFDLTPLFRNSVGFDRFDRLFDVAFNSNEGPVFPAYDIVKSGDDDYRISLAVAGYGEDDIDITQEGRTLTVSGKVEERQEESEQTSFLYRGIARRAFTRRFHLADTVRVTGAKMENGLLHIDLVNEIPEAEKPRQIEINGGKQKSLPQAA
ncbi:MAG: heat-shock protein [Rhizobiales bacterium NRL2]|jgi:molecular chaperone IbpA|nr:MAG: heat-shock protein [Rhizobiales bacterium NRL2]